MATETPEQYETKSLIELRSIAQSHGITQANKMNKQTIIKRLKEQSGGTEVKVKKQDKGPVNLKKLKACIKRQLVDYNDEVALMTIYKMVQNQP